jgi:hypothetical protein
MKKKMLRPSEKFVLICQSVRRNIPQDLSLRQHHTDSFQSATNKIILQTFAVYG